MNDMKITYGPPGHKGVTQIMGLGDDAQARQRAHKVVAGLAAGTWLVGALLGSNTLKNMGFGGGLAILACSQLMKKDSAVSKAVETVREAVPATIQGVG